MQSRNWLFRIQDILKAADKILMNTKDMDFSAFQEDEWAQDAAIRNFTIIGEAVKNLPEDFRSQHPDIAWSDIGDMRNILVHEYFGVDASIVWNAIKQDLPSLVEKLKAINLQV